MVMGIDLEAIMYPATCKPALVRAAYLENITERNLLQVFSTEQNLHWKLSTRIYVDL
jgi:hypothetical protein